MRELKKRKAKNGYFSFYSLQCYQGISQKNKLFFFDTGGCLFDMAIPRDSLKREI